VDLEERPADAEITGEAADTTVREPVARDSAPVAD